MSKETPELAAVSDEAPPPEGPQMTVEQAKALLEAGEQAVLRACKAELDVVLAKHDCVMIAIPDVAPVGNGAFALVAKVAIQPKPKG